MTTETFRKVLVENRKARHEFEILEVYQTGIELKGSEVKSIRMGRANLQDAFARVSKGEIVLFNLHISPMTQVGAFFQQDPTRTRKLLLHRREINKLIGKVEEKGLALVPLRLYIEKRWIKVDLAVARGKKFQDKREDLKIRDINREIERAKKGDY